MPQPVFRNTRSPCPSWPSSSGSASGPSYGAGRPCAISPRRMSKRKDHRCMGRVDAGVRLFLAGVSEQNGGGIFLLERFRAWGIGRVYGYPGDGTNGIMGIPDRAGNDPELIHMGHEEMSTVTACDAHARFDGEDVGFCVAPQIDAPKRRRTMRKGGRTNP